MLVSDKRFDYPQAFQFGVRPPGKLRIDESHHLAISDYDYVLDGRGDTITDLQGQLALTATTPWLSPRASSGAAQNYRCQGPSSSRSRIWTKTS